MNSARSTIAPRCAGALLAVATTCAASSAASAAEASNRSADDFGRKYIIAMGWDTGPRTIGEIADHADELAAFGLDGVVTGAKVPELLENGKLLGWGSPVYGTNGWNRAEEMEKCIPELRRLNASALTHNFLSTSLFFDKWHSFTEDDYWAAACRKVAAQARIAKLGGCRGLMIDTEDYPHVGQFYYIPAHTDRTYAEEAAAARHQGRAFMEAICREFPDAEILSTWLLSNQSGASYKDTYNGPLAHAEIVGDLFVPFMQGMVEGLSPEATLTDGDEWGYCAEATRREFYYRYCSIRQFGLGLMPPELRPKYNAQVRAGFGLYLDSYAPSFTNGWSKGPLDGAPLRHYELNLRQALAATDKYVWLWGEHKAYARWTNTLCKIHSDLPTWEDELPGISSLQRYAKDPKGYGDELWRNLLAAGGTAPANLIPSPGECVTVSNKDGRVATAPKGWTVGFGRVRTDGFEPKIEYVAEGHGGSPAVRQSGTFGGQVSFPGLPKGEWEPGAIYRASVWFKISSGKYPLNPSLRIGKTTLQHPVWNDGGGWMATDFKHPDDHDKMVPAGAPAADGWREAAGYFRAEAFETGVTLSAGEGRRLWEGEWVMISDPQVVKIFSPPKPVVQEARTSNSTTPELEIEVE